MNEHIVEKATVRAVDGQLACADAHAVAAELGVSPLEVGRAVNGDTSLRFFRCQVGVFGYGSKAEGKHKLIAPAQHVPEEIAAEIRAQAREGRIACAAVWALAEKHKYPRLGIANIVEALELRIAPCQLGCF